MYISHVGDLQRDGNCGVRLVASWLEFNEDQWRQIRRDLLNELELNKFE